MSAADAIAITDRLRALQETPGLPPRLAANCAALASRLAEPVRIGLFGLPGAGKLALLDALCGSALAPLAPLPTLELGFGAAASVEAMLPDGTLLRQAGLPTPDMLARGPAFLRLAAPVPGLRGRRYLLVACEADPREFAAALAWAAPRVDIALWCARGWSGVDAQSWGAAPDSLCNHAALVLSPQGEEAGDWHGAEGFEAVLPPDPARIARHLDDTAAEAASHDMAAAEWMLQRHGSASASAPAAMPRPEPTPDIAEPLRDSVAAPPEVPPEARAELGRLFQYLRGAAADLAEALPCASLDDAACAQLLERLGTVFDSLTARTQDLDRAQDSWPELSDMVFEAQDMALLLRMEGGPGQASDAARLLLQLRQDIEVRLAA
ncbi:hypothetical protein KO516_03380 [Citreicella sp. C3M06]|uniref:hypothetical protein n=1 Tax=Citreicella sp. C3M06 TaxID=2841564 RepID=UPI001C08F1A8|nr:hypothetical protein [Citreicella sp. C3M06]MBU2959882.1 hypothetical protein [Citreicella sp. C3M06]